MKRHRPGKAKVVACRVAVPWGAQHDLWPCLLRPLPATKSLGSQPRNLGHTAFFSRPILERPIGGRFRVPQAFGQAAGPLTVHGFSSISRPLDVCRGWSSAGVPPIPRADCSSLMSVNRCPATEGLSGLLHGRPARQYGTGISVSVDVGSGAR